MGKEIDERQMCLTRFKGRRTVWAFSRGDKLSGPEKYSKKRGVVVSGGDSEQSVNSDQELIRSISSVKDNRRDLPCCGSAVGTLRRTKTDQSENHKS
jgi:hypothetical protein